ncbi:TMV resistance protein N-like [Pyrus ussuriensis x Pyrus communis]|uniref:TMV resistance protein N-like n=1 Tax=Pyrus ussuriensis x Pyrus communis TaxID=2448454 RepID=A0A5N5FPL0_9ROSA|nr:TMV resistance protein N-like [Pyrus ussuriensis x Pyrus communis]
MALSKQRVSKSPAAAPWEYDVFISFRGEDTRDNFTDDLYEKLVERAIKTFRDDHELERGTTISLRLLNGIEESWFAIIVLSPNYASSTWCLDELSHIVECMEDRKTILPIFYHVDPSHVRKQTGIFAQAFNKHEKTFMSDTEKVQRWRTALTKVAFVKYAAKLPLTLKTLGIFLCGRDQGAWTSTLDKLKKDPEETTFKTLRVSYDVLDDMTKNVFLDVACFHKGNDKDRVIEILDCCDFSGRIGIDVLIEKSLLYVSGKNLEMHDLVQEMTWKIVRRKSKEPGRRSWLWLREDIFHVLKNNMVRNYAEISSLDIQHYNSKTI